MDPFTIATTEYLTSLSEADLQSKIIEPLLRLQGFTNVRNTSGANDKGKDLVACNVEFGRTKLYAIQIKKFRMSGKHNKTNALTHVLTQLRQIFGEEVIDPSTNTKRLPDRCMFVTPFEISRDALESAIGQVKELERHEITIIDGPLLVDLVLKLLPQEIEKMSVELQYRQRVSAQYNIVRETPAFGFGNLELDKIYVELAVRRADPGIEDFVARRLNLVGEQLVLGCPASLAELRSHAAKWGVARLAVSERPKVAATLRPRVAELKELLRRKQDTISEHLSRLRVVSDDLTGIRRSERQLKQLEQARVVRINLDPLLRTIRTESKRLLDRYLTIEHPDIGSAAATEIAREAIRMAACLSELQRTYLVSETWAPLLGDEPVESAPVGRLSSSAILKIDLPTFVTGAPGAGKTTLMRRLAQTMARNPDGGGQLPLLIYLVQFQTVPRVDVIEAAKHELSMQGHQISGSALDAAFKAGKFRMFFDGLDEAGANGERVLESISRFSARYPRCPVVVTMRDSWNKHVWPDSLHIRLTPMDDAQMSGFFEKWFTAEPSKLGRLIEWLTLNPDMKNAARTPIIAALLSSLVHAEAEMPATEVDLYQQRFELLLGRWEKAKGIPTLAPDVRRAYMQFLMSLACEYHRNGKRSGSREEAVNLAGEYFRRPFHRNADELVMDCVNRGLLEVETFGGLSFGHLTYQEYLVARWLDTQNPTALIWERLQDPWWDKTLNLYAAIKGDLSGLLAADLPRGTDALVRLQELVTLSAYTPESAMRQCEVQARSRYPSAFSRL